MDALVVVHLATIFPQDLNSTPSAELVSENVPGEGETMDLDQEDITLTHDEEGGNVHVEAAGTKCTF